MLTVKILLEITVIFVMLVLVCLIPLLIHGPLCMIFFYPVKVQKRAIVLGLTTKKIIKRNAMIFRLIIIPLYIGSLIVSVYFINGARDFWPLYWQMVLIAMSVNILDCFLIDEFWVRKTNMWIIKGTEDLKDEYVPLKAQIIKRVATTISILAVSAIIALIFSFI